MKANRKYKDNLFRSIFNDKEKLLELYNAIECTDYQDPQAIEITTLEDVLFMGMKNDISFILDGRLVLIEHQSTLTGNMPLRMSMYLNRVFEKITRTDSEMQYGSGSGDMPIPLLIILYNGKEDFPKEKTLYLESVFKKKEGVKIPVDMEIKVININKGCNPEIESRGKTLTAYITCIDKIREYEKIYPLDEAVKLAVKYCIDNDLYSEYFIKNSSEVMNMLTAEFNLDEYKKVMHKEGEKKGRAEGFEEGIEQGEKRVLKLMEQGLSYEEIKKRLEETSKKDH